MKQSTQKKTCWICASPSETGEHRIKRSDLSKRFGKIENDGSLVHVRGNQISPLPSDNSKLVKFNKNLCAHCNNTISQPFDSAYKELVDWVFANESDVLEKRTIDFEKVYSTDWETRQRNLFKYFAKCMGCRIDEANRTVPPDIRDLLPLEYFSTALRVSFLINEDQLNLQEDAQGIGTFGLCEHKDAKSGETVGYQCGHFYRWFSIMYWYNYFPLAPVGSPWIADSKHIYLGWHTPIFDNQ